MADQSQENKEVEQITKTPPPTEIVVKKKDPKKQAAGLKLAEYNRKTREEMKKFKEEKAKLATLKEEEEQSDVEKTKDDKPWIPELSFTTVLSIAGIAFTAFDIYMRFRSKPQPAPMMQVSKPQASPQPSKIPVPQPILNSKAPPKIGMQ